MYSPNYHEPHFVPPSFDKNAPYYRSVPLLSTSCLGSPYFAGQGLYNFPVSPQHHALLLQMQNSVMNHHQVASMLPSSSSSASSHVSDTTNISKRPSSPPLPSPRQIKQPVTSSAPVVPPHPRSEDFIGARVVQPETEASWTKQRVGLDESPFLQQRPTAEEVLDQYLAVNKPMGRVLQPFQVLMRGGLGRRASGVELSFLREQDSAFNELEDALSGRAEKEAQRQDELAQKREERKVQKQQEQQREERQERQRLQSASQQQEQKETKAKQPGKQKDASSALASSPRRPPLNRCATPPSPASSTDGSSRSAFTNASKSKGRKVAPTVDESDGTSGEEEEEEEEREPVKQPLPKKAKPTVVKKQPTVVKKRLPPRLASKMKGPRVEVTENDDIIVDGQTLEEGSGRYARIFGLAYLEKDRDPEFRIANGPFDRLYYRGSKKEAKERPGDYFPTDKAMLADFVRRNPEVFVDLY